MKNLVTEKPSVLDDSIDRVLNQMKRVMPDSEEYGALLTSLERLITLRNEEKQKRNKVSMDTLVIAGANLLGILIIVGYEHGHVVSSRALGMLLRTRHQ